MLLHIYIYMLGSLIVLVKMFPALEEMARVCQDNLASFGSP